MDLKAFLELIVPPGVLVAGKLVTATAKDGRQYKTVRHIASQLYTDIASWVEQNSKHSDVYFALASFKQGFYEVTNPKTGVTTKKLRTRENVSALKALWFDIDFKGEYSDLKTAAIALKVFCQQTRLPTPSAIIHSGNGLHAYIAFNQAIVLDRWQRLADALKLMAIERGFAHPELKPSSVDLGCTIDAARILRPPGTVNYKDPANPKPVRLIHEAGQTYAYEDLEAVLSPWIREAPVVIPDNLQAIYNEFTGGVEQREQSSFAEIVKHCGVMREQVENHGMLASEPMWTAGLQLLRFCSDGPEWIHQISSGHPGYSAEATQQKFEQRFNNSAGPTLCSTFETHEPKQCAKCPHRGFVKSPVMLGFANVEQIGDLPNGWKIASDQSGIEKRVPAPNGFDWTPALRHMFSNLRATRSAATLKYEMTFDVALKGSNVWSINLPGAALGNGRRCGELLAEHGVVLKEKEARAFNELMATWLEKLQANRRIADVTDQLGWLLDEHGKISGFAHGPTAFYVDGRVRNDVRSAKEFSAIARHYEPRGELNQWKKVSDFLTTQNNPAFTAILSAAFAAPLLRFTGHAGGILSIVSTASGVGKSSALKCSQSVWGSPTHGVNAVDDTPKSVARKLGFLNNLPAYWDELRGRKTVDDFLTLAFQITQGKEKTRLDSSAQLREVNTWETMLVVASNESIFEAMGRFGAGSDAGIVRTYEILVEPFATSSNRAQIALLFELTHTNYGHAGRIYAAHLATNQSAIEQRVKATFTQLATAGGMASQERFWFAIIASLIVGAQIANELGLTQIDVKSMAKFLMENLFRLRGRSVDTMTSSQPVEVLANFMAMHQDRALFVDSFPKPKQTINSYKPVLTEFGPPRADKIIYHVSKSENMLRIPKTELERWLQYREMPVHQCMKRFIVDLGAKEIRARLGLGTKWELPPQRLLEFDFANFGMTIDAIKSVALSSLDGSFDSQTPTAPASSTAD